MDECFCISFFPSVNINAFQGLRVLLALLLPRGEDSVKAYDFIVSMENFGILGDFPFAISLKNGSAVLNAYVRSGTESISIINLLKMAPANGAIHYSLPRVLKVKESLLFVIVLSQCFGSPKMPTEVVPSTLSQRVGRDI